IDARHSKVAQHDRVLDARHAIEELVRLKWMAAEGTSRIKHRTGNGWEPLAHLHVLASRWSERTCKSPRSSNVPSRSRHREELLVLAFVRYPCAFLHRHVAACTLAIPTKRVGHHRSFVRSAGGGRGGRARWRSGSRDTDLLVR